MSTRPIPPLAALTHRVRLADSSDADLLHRFVESRDEIAFAELVRRYGRLVWRIARGTTRCPATAEDVFQATFLALVRHAAAIRRPDSLAGWLHRTAHRVAVRSRRAETKRQAIATSEEPSTSSDPLDRLTIRELLVAVSEEIQSLPDGLRAAVVLCGVEGLSQEEAAARLGWSVGSVKGRLERGRKALRRRLAARGLTAPAGLLGLLGTGGGTDAVPLSLVEKTKAAGCRTDRNDAPGSGIFGQGNTDGR